GTLKGSRPGCQGPDTCTARITDPSLESRPTWPEPAHELGLEVFIIQWVITIDRTHHDAAAAVGEVAFSQRDADVARRLAGSLEECQVPRAPGPREPSAPLALVLGVPREADPLLEEHLLDEGRAVVAGRAPAPP